MKKKLIRFSLEKSNVIFSLAAVVTFVTVALAVLRILAAPDQIIDTDPENMLDKKEPVRVFHQATKEKFGLFDIVAMGIYYPGENGVFVPEILEAVNKITDEILALENRDYVLTAEGDTFFVDLRYEQKIEKMVDGRPVIKKQRAQSIIFDDLIALSEVEDVNGETGELVIKPLMPEAPKTLDAARRIKERIDKNPLISNKLASRDGKIAGIYIPIRSKKISYRLSKVLDVLAEKYLGPLKIDGKPFFGSDEHPAGEYIVAGIPVAQDTFGKFMFDQMGFSAPLAGLVIFILLFIFFKNARVIAAPMIMAVLAVIWTMSLLIAAGFTVHIMSSMIPIFLFPISVLNSIHIISSIHKRYGQHRSLKETIASTVEELYAPILFTSITTVVGFVSLILTFIPPVQVFGAFVGVGVALSWLLSVTFLPAYLIRAGEGTFKAFQRKPGGEHGLLQKTAIYLRWISQHYGKAVLVVSVLLFGVAAFGIAQIEINDNPVKWFEKGHPLRHADELMNSHVGGTYMANIVFDFQAGDFDSYRNSIDLEQLRQLIARDEIGGAFYAREAGRLWGSRKNGDQFRFQFALSDALLREQAEKIRSTLQSQNIKIRPGAALDPDAHENYDEVDFADFMAIVNSGALKSIRFDASGPSFYGQAAAEDGPFYFTLSDEIVQDRVMDTLLASLKKAGAATADTEEPFKNPEFLRYMEHVQRVAEGDRQIVGGVSSVLDILKKVSWELRSSDDAYYKLPDTKAETGQYIFLAQGGESPDDIYKFITRDFDSAHLWLHLNTGDNKQMEAVIERVDRFVQQNPPPKGVKINWAGLNYINTVWQQKMVGGMANSLIGAYITVFLMVVFLFRSFTWGAIAMIPITLTILLIYAMIGYFGKSYDMPIAVLSSLTLGLSIDFGIHYIERSRLIHKSTNNFRQTMRKVFGEPATAMLQNTFAISIGFVPLFFADLVPYKTVGAFFFAIMLISGFSTLIILPAISNIFHRKLFACCDALAAVVPNSAVPADSASLPRIRQDAQNR